MLKITANQANEIATRALQEREKDEKELQDTVSYIQERAAQGNFWARTPVCLSQNNINILKRWGFDVFNVYNDKTDLSHNSGTHISWYTD